MNPATSAQSRIRSALGAYASRFHTHDAHQAASPLGAYLLLATLAPLTDGATRSEIERVLGCSADEAREFATGLLEKPHPVVTAAAAVWLDARIENEPISRWKRALPRAIETGAIPSQAAANAWADRETRGAIKRFPLDIDPLTVLLAASAVATKAKWDIPYESGPPTRLGPCAWSGQVDEVLLAHERGESVIASTAAAGDVGVLLSRSSEGLLMVSAIATPNHSPAAVIGAAHELAALASGFPSPAKFHSLFDLPVGDGHAWSITEKRQSVPAPAVDQQWGQVFIPAWDIPGQRLPLLGGESRGFEPIVAALLASLPPHPEGYRFDAAQTACAQFNRSGFSAAAVSAFAGIAMSARGGFRLLKQTIRVRTATVRFARPFAVVAVAEAPPQPKQHWIKTSVPPPHPWRGLPIFTAWVTEPCAVEKPQSGW